MEKLYLTQQKDLYSVWSHLNELYTKWAELHGINCNTLMVLYGLDMHGDMTQKEICNCYAFPKQTVNNIIKMLQGKRYITLSSNANNKREKLVTLTPQGREYTEKVLSPLYNLEQQTIQLIGEERMSQMLEIAKLFNTVFEMKMEEKVNE